LLHVSSAGSDVNVGSGVCLRVCARVRACVCVCACVCVLESDLLFRIYLDCRFADLPIFTWIATGLQANWPAAFIRTYVGIFLFGALCSVHRFPQIHMYAYILSCNSPALQGDLHKMDTTGMRRIFAFHNLTILQITTSESLSSVVSQRFQQFTKLAFIHWESTYFYTILL